MRISRSFSMRLSTNILLITSILFITVVMIVSYFSHKLIAEEATKNATNILDNATLEIDLTLNNIENSVVNMQWVIEENLHDTAYLYHITHEIVNQSNEIIGSAIAFVPNFFEGKYYFSPYSYVDEKRQNITSKQLGNDKYNYFEMEWFKVSFESKKPHWSKPYFDEGGGQTLMSTFSFPLLDSKGNVFAILTADISLKWLNEKINSLKPYLNSKTILLCHDGTFISDNPNYIGNEETIFNAAQTHQSVHIEQLGKKMVAGDSGTFQIPDKDSTSFAVYGPLYNGWSTAIISPYNDVFAHAMRMNLIITIVSSLGLFLLFVICFRTVRRITQPITEFSVSARNMAKGNFQARLPQIKTKDEMLLLHDSFEYMQKSLTDYIRELRHTTAEKERYESELTVARNIQLNMVPRDFPNRQDCEIYAFLQPAREVGGDFYDFILKDDTLFFSIGDVSGKGVPAALFMSVTRAAFHFIGRVIPSLDQTVSNVNKSLCERNSSNMFVTLFAGRINIKTREMCYCNAGHNPIIICQPNGEVKYLRAKPNLAAGIMEEFPYQEEFVTLEKGSRLFLYTDGVTEAENEKKELFGEEKLAEFLAQYDSTESPKKIVSDLAKEIKKFAGKAAQNDDITILTINVY